MLIPLREEALASRKSSQKNPKTCDLLSTKHTKKDKRFDVIWSSPGPTAVEHTAGRSSRQDYRFKCLNFLKSSPFLSKDKTGSELSIKTLAFKAKENLVSVIHIFIGSLCCSVTTAQTLKNTEAKKTGNDVSFMRLTAENILYNCHGSATPLQLPRGLPRGLPRVVFGLFKDALFKKWREVTQVPFSEGPAGHG